MSAAEFSTDDSPRAEAAAIAYWEEMRAKHDRERAEAELEQFVEDHYPDWVQDRLDDGDPLPTLTLDAFLDWRRPGLAVRRVPM